MADFRGSMGLSVAETGELTGAADGLPDLFYTNWLAQENGLYQSLRMTDGAIEYRDRARPVRLAEDSLEMVGWGCGFADLDLDGRADLVIVNGSTLEQSPDRTRLIPQRLFVYWNDGRVFRNVAQQSGPATSEAWCARGLAVADFDDDGRIDLAISVNRGPVLLLRNETSTGNHALKIRLRGPSAACFGAKVEVTAGGRQQTRWWGADVSYLSGHAPELIFGLGQEQRADEVHVTWADGRVDSCPEMAAGRITIVHSHCQD
jgi:enediyne biosynthesis protein E4